MPNILKILGKSALCFIGLAAAGWATDKLNQFLLCLNGSLFYILLHATVIVFLLWFLLGVWYAYALFLVFKEEQNRFLIMALNGAGAAILFYLLSIFLWNIQTGAHVNMLITLSNIGASTILLAFIFKNLISVKPKHDEGLIVKKVIKNSIIVRSGLCFIGLSAVLYGYSFLLSITSLGIFNVLIISLLALFYAFILYRLLKKNKRRLLIMIINSVFLIAVWGMITQTYILIHVSAVFVLGYGSTALFTVALAFIFGSIEKRGNVENNRIKGDSSMSSAA